MLLYHQLHTAFHIDNSLSCCLVCLVEPSTAVPSALSTFLALFTTLSLVSCSLTCMLTLPPFIIMERVPPKVHLTILACVLVIFLLPLPLLRRRSIRLHLILGLFRQPQTWIMILKLMFDFSLVVLHTLDISKVILLNKGKSRLI